MHFLESIDFLVQCYVTVSGGWQCTDQLDKLNDKYNIIRLYVEFGYF